MAGIYIHIPFCKKACHYCDFHFSTSTSYKNELILSLLKEIELRKDYLSGEPIDTIYFGGGTPSLLHPDELRSILKKIQEIHPLNATIECTLEANPDDLSIEKIQAFKEAGINRLSIGIQSFFDEDLQFMNRSHDAQQAERCINAAREAGIENFSIDLIFGYPLLHDEKWKHNIDQALSFQIPHLSCYAMTVEPKTALASFIKKKQTPPVSQEQSARQFEYLMQRLQENGYEHYEISNYALPGKRAVHNSNYWRGISYLGLGPSAHSFNGSSRQWNVANNKKYMLAIDEGRIPSEVEFLTKEQQINERIMTSLRTAEGLDLREVSASLSNQQRVCLNREIIKLLDENLVSKDADFLKLTSKGKLFADYIAGELFIEA